METQLKIGDIVEAEVTRITEFGAFVKINGRMPGLIHISQIAESFVKDVREHLQVGERVKARVIKLGPGKKIDLSLKRLEQVRPQRNNAGSSTLLKGGRAGFKSSDFEEKLKKFLQESQQSLADLKKHQEKYHR